MEGTPMRLVILILGLLAGIALVGAIGLKGVHETVPNELWMITSGSIAALGALLANPRSGAATRETDAPGETIPLDQVESIQVESLAPKKKR